MMLVVTASPWLAVRTDVMPAAFGASFPANDPVQADWAASGLMRDGRVCGIMSSPHGGVPMLSRIQALGPCLIVLTLLLFAGSAAAQDVSPRCEAAMDRAAGHYSKCLLSADASHARHKNATKLANRQARCETRFDRRTSRAITRHGADACPSSDLVAAMADRTVTYAEGAATEAGGTPAPSLLFVQNGTGGTLSETTLTLTDVSSKTGYFSDRPYREAAQVPTEEFIALWDEGEPFAEDPPNADFTCTVDSEVVNYVVELTSPSLVGGDLSYDVSFLGGAALHLLPVTCEADANVFIDGASCNSKPTADGVVLPMSPQCQSLFWATVMYQVCNNPASTSYNTCPGQPGYVGF